MAYVTPVFLMTTLSQERNINLGEDFNLDLS
jgi:hypothetical protein